MITAKTIERIWSCQREVSVGKELLEEMKKIEENVRHNPAAERMKDAFGRQHNLQLGVPSGRDTHRLLNVSPKLAVSIITAHIANKEAELIEANEQAKIELSTNKAEA